MKNVQYLQDGTIILFQASLLPRPTCLVLTTKSKNSAAIEFPPKSVSRILASLASASTANTRTRNNTLKKNATQRKNKKSLASEQREALRHCGDGEALLVIPGHRRNRAAEPTTELERMPLRTRALRKQGQAFHDAKEADHGASEQRRRWGVAWDGRRHRRLRDPRRTAPNRTVGYAVERSTHPVAGGGRR